MKLKRHYYWEDIVRDFQCMRIGKDMRWEISSDSLKLFIDGNEINTTDYYYEEDKSK